MFKINPDLQYKNLGNSGLVISELAFGNSANEELSHEQNVAIVKRCLELGINYFDTAELYWDGGAETSLGKIFKELQVERQTIVVGTKIWIAKNPDLNSDNTTNKKHIRQGVKASLQRLQMDYVDIIFPHSHDQNTSIEEICRGFHEVIEDGMAFYWGTSNWDADKIIQAFEVCEKYNFHKPIAAQNQYNMMVRQQMQSEYRKLFEVYKYGLLGFGPLLGGYLTGKYLEKDAAGRFGNESKVKQIATELYIDRNINQEQCNEIIKALKEFAQNEMGCQMIHLALAWALKFKYITGALIGSKSIQQVEGCFKAVQLAKKITPQIQGKINKILGTHPDDKMDCKSWKPLPKVRQLAE